MKHFMAAAAVITAVINTRGRFIPRIKYFDVAQLGINHKLPVCDKHLRKFFS